MKVFIKRIEESLPLPVYETHGSVGFDFLAREPVTIQPGKIELIPSNMVIQTPPGYALIVVPRSSTPKKKCLDMPHSIGVIDQDYSGEKDEIMIQVRNFSTEEVKIKRGERIAQGIFIKVEKAEFIEKTHMSENNRGGFGSTD
jgi:dUTP pyrophosphatase